MVVDQNHQLTKQEAISNEVKESRFPARVNGNLRLRFQASGLTSFAGLEFIRRYFKSIDLVGRIRRHLGQAGLDGDYGVVAMVLLVLGVLICGGRRMQHVLYLKEDPLMLRLARLPTPRTLGRWLRRFRMGHVERLLRINDDLVADAIRQAGLRRLTLDVDGTVVSTGLKAQWASRGFNPHHRKVPSYYPVTAYEAQTQLADELGGPWESRKGRGADAARRSLRPRP